MKRLRLVTTLCWVSVCLLPVTAVAQGQTDEEPSEEALAACIQSAREFAGEPKLTEGLAYRRTLRWHYVSCYELRSPAAFFMVGAEDQRVRGFHRMVPTAPALEQPLSVEAATRSAQDFLERQGLKIAAGMKLVQQAMEEAGLTAGHVSVEWRAHQGEVRLPAFYSLTVSSLNGEVVDFAMCDVAAQVGLTPKLSAAEVAQAARGAEAVTFEPVNTEDRGLVVWVQPDGTQRLCRVVDVHGPPAEGPMPPILIRLVIDANTGEVVCVGQAG